MGSENDGLWMAPTSTLAFTKVSDLHVRCLTWTAAGLYACGDEVTDGFTAGVSTDGGKTFAPFMTAQSFCGAPESCGAESSVGKICPPLWPTVASTIGNPHACGASATTSAASSSGSASSSGGATTTDGGKGGCGCSASGQGIFAPSALALGVVGALCARRRRRLREA